MPLSEQQRRFALRSFSVSHSSIRPLTAANGALHSDDIRPAGIAPDENPNIPRPLLQTGLERKLHSLGATLSDSTRPPPGPALKNCTRFAASALMGGSLREGHLHLHAPFPDHSTPLPYSGAPVHPARNEAVRAAALRSSNSRAALSPGPRTTLFEAGAVPHSTASELNALLGCHVRYDRTLASRASSRAGSERGTLSAPPSAPAYTPPHSAPAASSFSHTHKDDEEGEKGEGGGGGGGEGEVGAGLGLEELRALRAETEQAAFGWSYRRDHAAPDQARGRKNHTYLRPKAVDANITAGPEPPASAATCLGSLSSSLPLSGLR